MTHILSAIMVLSAFAQLAKAQDKYPLLLGYIQNRTDTVEALTRIRFSDDEEAMRDLVRAAIRKAMARVDTSQSQLTVFEIGSRQFLNDRDTSIPLSFYHSQFWVIDTTIHNDWHGNTATFYDNTPRLDITVNPPTPIKFKISGAFRPVVAHGGRYAIQCDQEVDRGEFTAVFLGAFEELSADTKDERVQRRYPSLEAMTSYGKGLSYLRVQAISVVFWGKHEIANKVLSQIDFAALSELIDK